jgi:sarcosine oxidase, subunit gamma
MEPDVLKLIDPVCLGRAFGPSNAEPSAFGPHPRVRFRVLSPLHAVSLRTLEPDNRALLDTLCAAGVLELPGPDAFTGQEVRVVWSGPTEFLVLTPTHAAATALLDAMRPGISAQSCAVDLSAGTIGMELSGPGTRQLLVRLVDALAIPKHAGQAARTRLADVAVHLLCLDKGRLWLLADRMHAEYLVDWLLDARQRVE